MLMTLRNEVVKFNRPTVIMDDAWVNQQVAIGQLKVLFKLPAAATDAEWVDWLAESDGDISLAVASYKSKYFPDAELSSKTETVKAPVPTKKG
jgi:hypothetical protein